MIRTHRVGKRPAWLAMVALWLTITVPVVSQILAGCSSGHGAASYAQQMAHMEHPCPPDTKNPHPDPMTFCGYCSLFHHTSLLASAHWQPCLLGALPYPPFIAPALHNPLVRDVLAAAPRGPPNSVPV